jgi:hypothetical protein
MIRETPILFSFDVLSLDYLAKIFVTKAFHIKKNVDMNELFRHAPFIISALLSIGVKESTLMNNIFTGLNLVTVSIVLVAGSMKGK